MKILGGLEKRLHQLRKEKKLRQKDMADFLGMTLRNYQRIDAGEIDVAASQLCELADYFGVSVDYLLGRTDER
ncbi:MAG: helix-turn-helix transcriptional regulator [Oscillibacter sp.]|jgi:transcriptional regulator with XRE-family HTH domain|nr:helix-turn-helix transcriptional regulator [Oscillibacter sp.]